MPELRPIRAEAIPKALMKAERFRLLGESREAESICRDVLLVEPKNQGATATLLLAITDQFSELGGARPAAAMDLLEQITDPYERAYLEGVICVRWAKSQLLAGGPGLITYEWLTRAMNAFDRAALLSPPGNDDATLRWNTCVRLLQANPEIRAIPEEFLSSAPEPIDDEDVPI